MRSGHGNLWNWSSRAQYSCQHPALPPHPWGGPSSIRPTLSGRTAGVAAATTVSGGRRPPGLAGSHPSSPVHPATNRFAAFPATLQGKGTKCPILIHKHPQPPPWEKSLPTPTVYKNTCLAVDFRQRSLRGTEVVPGTPRASIPQAKCHDFTRSIIKFTSDQY